MFRILSATFVLWVCLRGTALADVLYTVEELLPLPGFPIAHAYSVNDSGQVVGYSYLPATYFPGTIAVVEPAQIAPMFWDGGTATALAAPSGGTVFVANDINNSGQIVGQGHGCNLSCDQPDDDTGFISLLNGSGNWATVAPGSLASVPLNGPQCHQDDFLTAISDTGYMTSLAGGISSPNMSTDLCGLDVSALYESGLMLTDIGYVHDPLIDFFYDQGSPIAVNDRAWVVVPSCTGDVTGYALSGNSFGFTPPVPLPLEVSDQVAASICGLVGGEIHDKDMNALGQFIVNVGDRAFLYSPVPAPGTLALLGLVLFPLAWRFGRA